jgi:anti-sigma-K factor RskA
MAMDRDRLLNLISAYVLCALSDEDAVDVEQLLATDNEAQQLLEDYQAVADSLLLTVPSQPAPTGLRDDLRRRLQASSEPDPSDKDQPQTITVTVMPAWRRYPLPLAVVLALVIAGLVLILSSTQSPSSPSPETLYNELAAAEDSRSIALVADFDEATYGDLVISSNGQQAVIRVNQLPTLTMEEAFQLWLVDDDGAVSGGVFQFQDPAGPNYIVLPLAKPVDDYLRFGVSIEPATGSPLGNRPSGPRAFGVTITPQQSG